MKKVCVLLVGIFSFCPQQFASPPVSPVGFIDLNAYYDTRNHTDYTLNVLLNYSKFQYFSLTNFELPAESMPGSFYTEHHFRRNVLPSGLIKLTGLFTANSFAPVSNFKFGVLLAFNEFSFLKDWFSRRNLSFFVNFHLIELRTDGTRDEFSQIEYVYFWKGKNGFWDRIYITGFADQNLDNSFTSTWVTEHQLGLRLVQPLHFVAEWRLNEYVSDKMGLGIGLSIFQNF